RGRELADFSPPEATAAPLPPRQFAPEAAVAAEEEESVLGADRRAHLAEGVAGELRVAQQPEQLAVGVGAPEVVDVAAAQVGAQHGERLAHGAVLHVRRVAVPGDAGRRVAALLHDPADVLRLLRAAPMYLQPNLGAVF